MQGQFRRLSVLPLAILGLSCGSASAEPGSRYVAVAGAHVVRDTVPPELEDDTLGLPPTLSRSPTPLAGITGTKDRHSNIREPNAAPGGGLEFTRAFSTKLYPNLRPCGTEVHTVGARWLRTLNLVPSVDESSTRRVRILAWTAAGDGALELRYQTTADGTHARVWVNYYTLTGVQLAPESAPNLFQTYKISQLWPDLEGAISCFA